MKTNKLYILLTIILFTILTACNKGKDDFFYKGDMLPVTITGYNASEQHLQIKLDTVSFKSELSPNQLIRITEAYTFIGNQQKANLLITEKGTGKKVLEKEVKKGDGPTTISLFYMNGQVSSMPEKPPVEEGKNKIIYMFKPTYTNYTEPVDIAFGKFYTTPRVFEELARLKNVKPNEFTEAVTVPCFSTAAGQQYNGQNTSVGFRARIYKAGTNELYTEGTPYTWVVISTSAPVPAASTAASKLYIFEEAPSGTNMVFSKKLEL